MKKISDLFPKTRTVTVDGVEVEVEAPEKTEAQLANARFVKIALATTTIVAAVAVYAKVSGSKNETDIIENAEEN
jgi:hypothetical protein